MPEFIERRNVQQLRDLLETTCNESLREVLLKKLAEEEANSPRPEPHPPDRRAAPVGGHRRPSGTKTPSRAA
jgi:hypothetical protein